MDDQQPAQVMPMISVVSVDRARDYYVDKLGFSHLMAVVGNDGQIDFCTVALGGGKIMFMRGETAEAPRPSAQFYFQVRDVNAYHRALVATGIPVSALEDMWWGDRVFTLVDVNGYTIWFYQTVAEPRPPVGTKIV